MTCSCPKCSAQIEVDLPRISENGTFMPCPECKGRFWINKESYARMSLKKDGNIYCDQCGKELDHKIVCVACGVMFPDYYLVQASKPPRRQIEKTNLFSVSFSLKPARQYASYDYKYTSTKKTAGVSPGFKLQKVGALAVVLLIAASLGYFFHMKKEEKLFASNYMRALYTIKTGTDLSIDTCSKISADWNSYGQNYSPRISADDESRLNKVKGVADRYMQTLNDPPKKYISNKEKIANLYSIYVKAYGLAVSPSGSLTSFSNAAAKTQNEFNSAAKALKDNIMSGAMSKEFQIAKTKYKGLQNI